MDRLIPVQRLLEKPRRVEVLCPRSEVATDTQVRRGRVIRGD